MTGIKEKIFHIVCAVLVICSVVQADDQKEPQAVFRPDMPTNRWIRVRPRYVPPPGGGKHVPQHWNKLVYDPVGKRCVYMDRWSDDVRGNTIYANAVMTFDVKANLVTCIKLTNWKRQSRKKGGYSTVPMPENEKDPTPCDRHPYGNLAFVPHQNAVYLSRGANRSARDGDKKGHRISSDTWRLTLKTAEWSKVDESKAKPPGGHEDVMAYDAKNRVIVRICRGQATWLLDVDKGTWRDAETENNPQSGMGAAMCYDDKRSLVYVFGGAGKNGQAWNTPHPECYAYSVIENTWKRLADAPVPVRAMGAAYDSKRDVVMIHAGRKKNPYFFGFYDPAGNQWLRLELPDNAPKPVPSWHTLTYDAANDVYVRAAGPWSDPQWWLFRPDLSAAAAVRKEDR